MVAMVLVAWLDSYWSAESLGITLSGLSRALALETVAGEVRLNYLEGDFAKTLTYWKRYSSSTRAFQSAELIPHQFLGFAANRDTVPDGSAGTITEVCVPFWFLTLSGFVLTISVWRWHRNLPSRMAFPIT